MTTPRFLAVVAAGLICAAASYTISAPIARLIFALPLALYLPGYAVAAALFAPRRLNAVPSLVLSAGFSLVLLVIGGVVLNYLPGGIRRGAWEVLLAIVVTVACSIAWLRRLEEPGTSWRPAMRLPSIAVIALMVPGLVAAVAAIFLAFIPLHAKNVGGYTELWWQPAQIQHQTGVRVGITSDEKERTAYRLTIEIGHHKNTGTFTLAPGSSQLVYVPAPRRKAATRLGVKIWLGKAPHSKGVYRYVYGWITSATRS
jgi:Protein of unknown function (DUF1616)